MSGLPEQLEPEAQFCHLVQEEFGFLSDRGFRMARSDVRVVRFESDSVAVTFELGWGVNDVGGSIARREQRGRESQFSLYEVLQAVSPTDVHMTTVHARSVDILRQALRELACVLENKARPLLAGDEAAFKALERCTAPGREAATLSATYGATRHRGDQAWDEGGRAAAADLYDAARPLLDPMRQRRLDYIRKRSGEDSL